MGLEMPLVHTLAAMEHSGIAFSSSALTQQMPRMCLRLEQLKAQAAHYIRVGDVCKVLWNKQRGPGALSLLLYGTVESGGLGLIPPVDTAKGR
jgi:hypothetical protein